MDRNAQALSTRPIKQVLDLHYADEARRGNVPTIFNSYSELIDAANILKAEGKTKKEIYEALGIKGINLKESKSGFSLDTRMLAERIPKPLIDHLEAKEAAGELPKGFTKDYIKDVKRGWNESGRRTQQLTKTTGLVWHNGHWTAASEAGPTSGRNANPELASNYRDIENVQVKGNPGHGAAPRRGLSPDEMRSLGMPTNWLEDAYEYALQRSGLFATGLNRTLTDKEAFKLDTERVSPGQVVTQGRMPKVDEFNPNVEGGMAGPLKVVKSAWPPLVTKVMQPIAGATAALPAIGAMFDVGDVKAGTTQALTGGSSSDKLAGTLQALGGAAGLASLVPMVAPLAAPASLALTGTAGAIRANANVKQKAKVQAEQLIPVPRPVMANTPTGVAQLKAMPKSKTLIETIDNELRWLGKAGQRAFNNIFGGREI